MVDLNDFSYKTTSRHGKPVRNKVYRHYCNSCGSDKGYLSRGHNTPTCNKCSRKGTILSEQHKLKISIATIKRYNDPTWISKIKEHKQRVIRHYKSYKTPIQRKMHHTMRTLLWQKLINHSINKNGKTFDLLGYTANDLIKHLESKFELGMTWSNYGIGGWEIDHIIPDSWFQYSSTNDEGFKNSWKLGNLQPMWAINNRIKGNHFAGKENI